MGRPSIQTESSDHERVIRRRNAICSELLLRSLRRHHGEMDLIEEPEFEAAPEPEPEPKVEELTQATITELPIVHISLNKIEVIKKAVCQHYNITKASIESPSKAKKFTFPRQVGMYLSRQLTDYSLQYVAWQFGKRDHTTVVHAEKKITDLAGKDEGLARDIAKLMDDLEPVRAIPHDHHL